MTIRARSGSAARVRRAGCRGPRRRRRHRPPSPAARAEEPLEARARRERLRGFPLVHGPLPEVELEAAHAVLDHPPQGPAVAGDEPPELGPGDQRVEAVLRRPRGRSTRVHRSASCVGVEVRLGRRVAELEGRLVHPRVLVVDDPQVAAVVEDVRREQVVVARHEHLGSLREDRLHPLEVRLEREVGGRHPESAVAHDGEVLGAHREHVEPAEEGRPGVQPAQGGGQAHRVRGDVGVAPGATGQELDDHHPAALEVVDDGRSDACGRGCEGVGVLGVPVDSEQPGVRRGDAHDDVEPAIGAHPVVEVGQPTGQGRHVTPLPGEDGDAVEQRVEIGHGGVPVRTAGRRASSRVPSRRGRSCRGARARSPPRR